jgi:hypothetical protein
VTTQNTTAAANHTFIFKVISQGKQTVYNTAQVALEVLAIPVVIPPIVNPPTNNGTNGSGLEIPWLPLIAIVVIIGAVGGAAAYARSRKKKPAWEPTQPAQTPGITEVVPETEPAGMKSRNGFVDNYGSTNRREDYADSSPYSVPPAQGVQMGAGELTEPQGKLNDLIDKAVSTGEGVSTEAGDSGLAGGMRTGDLNELGKPAEDLNGKAKDWLVEKGMPLADKLPGPVGDWAKKGEKFGGQGGMAGEPTGDSGPRFESPDWSPDDEPAVQARRPEPPPQYERVEPVHPPEQAAPPPPAPASKSVTELEELMNRLKNLSRK